MLALSMLLVLIFSVHPHMAIGEQWPSPPKANDFIRLLLNHLVFQECVCSFLVEIYHIQSVVLGGD